MCEETKALQRYVFHHTSLSHRLSCAVFQQSALASCHMHHPCFPVPCIPRSMLLCCVCSAALLLNCCFVCASSAVQCIRRSICWCYGRWAYRVLQSGKSSAQHRRAGGWQAGVVLGAMLGVCQPCMALANCIALVVTSPSSPLYPGLACGPQQGTP